MRLRIRSNRSFTLLTLHSWLDTEFSVAGEAGRALWCESQTKRPALPGGNAGRFHTGYPESEDLLLRFSSLGHRLNWSVCGLASRAPVFIPEWFARPLGSPVCALQVGWIADQPLARHAAALLQRGWDTRLVSTLQHENDLFSNWRRQHRKSGFIAQEGDSYPLTWTFRTFSTAMSETETICQCTGL